LSKRTKIDLSSSKIGFTKGVILEPFKRCKFELEINEIISILATKMGTLIGTSSSINTNPKIGTTSCLSGFKFFFEDSISFLSAAYVPWKALHLFNLL
jgi:hypothetical protein